MDLIYSAVFFFLGALIIFWGIVLEKEEESILFDRNRLFFTGATFVIGAIILL
jgi:hypothetical protein